MKKQQIEKLIKKYLIVNLESFRVKGNLIYRICDEQILQGILVESSTLNSNELVASVFVQLLNIPATSIVLSNGFRLEDKKRKVWWILTEGNEAVLFNEMLQQLKTKALPYLDKLKSLDALYDNFKNVKNKSIREQEFVTVSAILSNSSDANNQVEKLLKLAESKEYKELKWVREICGNILKLTDSNTEKRTSLLTDWKTFTLDNIKLPV